MDDSVKIALYGPPGSGKSSAAGILEDYCGAIGLPCAVIKLADPLYEAQSAVYRIAGANLDDFYQKDGELLNSLGRHMRRINPMLLHDRFLARLHDVRSALGDAPSLVVCDDMRFPDHVFMRSIGFTLVRVFAPDEVCLSRRRERGDLSLASPTHVTENNLHVIEPDGSIDNSGTFPALRRSVIETLEKALGASAPEPRCRRG
ncbi:nucleoside/nucleotide kinase family protein [Nonomuraea wenchangensis]|uniref:Cytidine deaminase n=1 Tax=Nonomuraea wenchangensis TaxID=568860 RepID=A0A1I0JU84_9ACTN|nr:hypothetical protein [Nonomuraea wenchangensis]SEU14215.1 cytidine deaminase [Nonomuraea wenchangensis]